MKVLALDTATKIGWALGDGSGLPLIGTYRLDADRVELGAYFSEAWDWLSHRLTEWEPSVVVFEAPAPGRFNSVDSTRKTQGLTGLVELLCFRRNVECREATPGEAKKAFTGRGNAKKHEIVAAARAYGLRPATYLISGKEASDEADAFAVWISLIQQLDRDLATRWPAINIVRAA